MTNLHACPTFPLQWDFFKSGSTTLTVTCSRRSQTPATPPPSTSSSSVPVGAIVGGVVGGLGKGNFQNAIMQTHLHVCSCSVPATTHMQLCCPLLPVQLQCLQASWPTLWCANGAARQLHLVPALRGAFRANPPEMVVAAMAAISHPTRFSQQAPACQPWPPHSCLIKGLPTPRWIRSSRPHPASTPRTLALQPRRSATRSLCHLRL